MVASPKPGSRIFNTVITHRGIMLQHLFPIKDRPGIKFGGYKTSLRYADDTLLIDENDKDWHPMLDTYNKEY